MYNFDELIDRRGHNSKKWDQEVLEDLFGQADALPLWVADMDFKAPDFILEAVRKVADHGIYGYVSCCKHIDAFTEWLQKRYQWKVDPNWVVNTAGVVTAVAIAVQTFSQKGDKVLINRPVYYPFTDVILANDRQVVSSSLLLDEEGHYSLDWEDFEEKLEDPAVKIFILCSPHNPIGRIWTQEELTKMMELCLKYKVLVVSDEIHADLTMPGYHHVPSASISPTISENVITCMAASKTFNLAGMQVSQIVIPNPDHRHAFIKTMEKSRLGANNPFGVEAAASAYRQGDQWLEELIDYIWANYQYLKDRFEALDGVKVHDLQATFLAWLDFRGLGLDQATLNQLIFQQAKVALDAGDWFGPEGQGFMRLNLACPRSILAEACDRIENTLNDFMK